MIQNEREIRHELVLQAARRMMTAARTAPKGKGIDIIEIAMVTDGDILRLSDEMIRIAAETGFKFLLRDAENIKSADAVVIIGTSQKVQGLNCAIAVSIPAWRSRTWFRALLFRRSGYRYRLGLRYGGGPACGYSCHVQRRLGGPTTGAVGRL